MNVRSLGTTAATAFALCAIPSLSHGQVALPAIPPEMELVRTELSKYKDFNRAEGEFYAALGCIWYGDIDTGVKAETFSGGGGGAMTEISYPMMQDGKIDPLKPEGLIYEQGEGGKFELAAALYLVPATPDTPRPSLFGRPFEGPIHAEKATPLQHVNLTVYEMHVWFWKENPDGLFTRTNPNLPCLFDSYEVRAEPAPFSAPQIK